MYIIYIQYYNIIIIIYIHDTNIIYIHMYIYIINVYIYENLWFCETQGLHLFSAHGVLPRWILFLALAMIFPNELINGWKIESSTVQLRRPAVPPVAAINQPGIHEIFNLRSMWIKTCGCTQRKPKVVKLFVLVFPRKDQDFDSLWLSLCVCPRFHFDIMKWFNISPCRIRVFVSLDARNLNKEASTTHINWSRGHPM